ncbi:MAG: FkbM family methyltransferase [Flavobacteriia bacterium]|nr:FkbM family methyltransferase [Flavobacteriia bacterium]
MITISLKTRVFNFFRSIFKIQFLERFLVNKISKKGSLYNFYSKLIPCNYQYSKNSIRVFEKNGIKFKVDISEYISHYIYFGLKDPGFDQLMSLSKDSKVIFDIGANIGFTALNMATLSKNAIVYAFEPDSFNFNKLESNFMLNNLNNLIILNFGLGDEEDKFKLAIVTPDNLGGNSIDNSATENFSWVEIKRLDAFVESNDIKSLDLIKIDVEGFELNVLKGAEKIIKEHLPTMFIEVDDNNLKNHDSSAKELIIFLEKFYTNIFDAESKKKITSYDDFTNCHFDVVTMK